MLRNVGGNRPARYALVLGALIVLGYPSNTITAPACERETGAWLKAILSRSDWPHRRAHHEPAEYRYPWVVTVDYSWTTGNVGREDGTRYYFGLFGISVPLGEDVHELS